MLEGTPYFTPKLATFYAISAGWFLMQETYATQFVKRGLPPPCPIFLNSKHEMAGIFFSYINKVRKDLLNIKTIWNKWMHHFLWALGCSPVPHLIVDEP